MVIYVIMTSFRTSNQGPIINYVGSNHLITGLWKVTVIHLSCSM